MREEQEMRGTNSSTLKRAKTISKSPKCHSQEEATKIYYSLVCDKKTLEETNSRLVKKRDELDKKKAQINKKTTKNKEKIKAINKTIKDLLRIIN